MKVVIIVLARRRHLLDTLGSNPDPPPTAGLIFIHFFFCRVPKPTIREKSTVRGMGREGGGGNTCNTCTYNYTRVFNLNANTRAKFIPSEDLGFFCSGQ